MAAAGEPTTHGETHTPMIAVLLGGGVTVLEAIFDILYADLYTGEIGGVVVSEGEIIFITVIGLALALGILWYGYTNRLAPTTRVYTIIAVGAIISGVVGILFANIITLTGAVWGYLTVRGRG
jgi:hypothetical protein